MEYKSGEKLPVSNNETTLIKAQMVKAICMNFSVQIVNACLVIYFNENLLDVH